MDEFYSSEESYYEGSEELYSEDSGIDLNAGNNAVVYDNNVAMCHSLAESKSIIANRLNLDPKRIRNYPVEGLVVMHLRDFNLIRNDSRNARGFFHIIVIPDTDFGMLHPDFACALMQLDQLNKVNNS